MSFGFEVMKERLPSYNKILNGTFDIHDVGPAVDKCRETRVNFRLGKVNGSGNPSQRANSR